MVFRNVHCQHLSWWLGWFVVLKLNTAWKNKITTAGRQRETSLTYAHCSLLGLAAVIMRERENVMWGGQRNWFCDRETISKSEGIRWSCGFFFFFFFVTFLCGLSSFHIKTGCRFFFGKTTLIWSERGLTPAWSGPGTTGSLPKNMTGTFSVCVEKETWHVRQEEDLRREGL